jgi:hypothetical protein
MLPAQNSVVSVAGDRMMKRIVGCVLFAATLSFGTALAKETRILGVIAQYTDTSWPAHSPAILNSLLFGGGNSVRSYYNEGSGGAHRVTGNVHPQVLTISQSRPPGKCTLPNASMLGEAIRSAGIDPRQYTMIAVVVTSSQGGCNGGMQVGFNHFDPATRRNVHLPLVIVWSLTDRFILHETGHAHGLGHAKTLNCGKEVLIGACNTGEYGDFTDTMANGVIQTHGAAMRKVLGWGRTITHTSGTTTYTIGPAYAPGALPNGLEVRLPNSTADGLTINAPISLWIEYRQPRGFDSRVQNWPGIANGALVKATGHWTYAVDGRTYSMDCRGGATCLIDMTPGDNDFHNAALPVGATWTDKHTGASIRVAARTEETLTVTVSIP